MTVPLVAFLRYFLRSSQLIVSRDIGACGIMHALGNSLGEVRTSRRGSAAAIVAASSAGSIYCPRFGRKPSRYNRTCMRAYFFGPPSKRLFGVLDEPAIGGASELGVVLCYPRGADYDSAFRSFRIPATRLAPAVCHVLRFDYLGTGDSAGDVDDASIPRWTADVVTAVGELRRSREFRDCVEGPAIRSRTPSMDEASMRNGAMQAIVAWLAGASR